MKPCWSSEMPRVDQRYSWAGCAASQAARSVMWNSSVTPLKYRRPKYRQSEGERPALGAGLFGRVGDPVDLAAVGRHQRDGTALVAEDDAVGDDDVGGLARGQHLRRD